MSLFPEPSPENNFLADHITLLQSSYQRLIGKDLKDFGLMGKDLGQEIYYAPFIVVSHGIEADPIFNYANLTAQQLFEMNWSEFTQLLSRQSAEVPNQAERAKLLEAVTTKGFFEGYEGVRISKTGKRFLIQDVTVWNLTDEQGIYQGQAAVYSRWQFLDFSGAT